MAYAFRTDSRTWITDEQHPDYGKVQLAYTEGEAPLPSGPSGIATLLYPQELIDQIAQAEQRIREDLKFLAWARGTKVDPALGETFASAVVGRVSTLDLSPASPVIDL